MAKPPEFVSVANVWPAESQDPKSVLRQASKRLSSLNPAEAARIRVLAGEVE